MQVFIYCKFTVHVSCVLRTNHQEYMKMYLQPLVQVILQVQMFEVEAQYNIKRKCKINRGYRVKVVAISLCMGLLGPA